MHTPVVSVISGELHPEQYATLAPLLVHAVHDNGQFIHESAFDARNAVDLHAQAPLDNWNETSIHVMQTGLSALFVHDWQYDPQLMHVFPACETMVFDGHAHAPNDNVNVLSKQTVHAVESSPLLLQALQ